MLTCSREGLRGKNWDLQVWMKNCEFLILEWRYKNIAQNIIWKESSSQKSQNHCNYLKYAFNFSGIFLRFLLLDLESLFFYLSIHLSIYLSIYTVQCPELQSQPFSRGRRRNKVSKQVYTIPGILFLAPPPLLSVIK